MYATTWTIEGSMLRIMLASGSAEEFMLVKWPVGRTWRSTAGLHVEILQGSQTISGEAFKKPILGLISLLLYSFEKNRADSDRVSKILFVSKVVGCFLSLLQSNVYTTKASPDAATIRGLCMGSQCIA
jgi:hypothetical protein